MAEPSSSLWPGAVRSELDYHSVRPLSFSRSRRAVASRRALLYYEWQGCGGDVAGFKRAASVDVAPQIREGQNVLAVRVENADGLAAFRMMLGLATERGWQSWVIPDGDARGRRLEKI